VFAARALSQTPLDGFRGGKKVRKKRGMERNGREKGRMEGRERGKGWCNLGEGCFLTQRGGRPQRDYITEMTA